MNALEDSDYIPAAVVGALPDTWREVNDKETTVTKYNLKQCVWGAHAKSDILQNIQQAIITSYPPTPTHVTQYTTQLTAAICNDSTV
jgi:hypothetical protein